MAGLSLAGCWGDPNGAPADQLGRLRVRMPRAEPQLLGPEPRLPQRPALGRMSGPPAGEAPSGWPALGLGAGVTCMQALQTSWAACGS